MDISIIIEFFKYCSILNIIILTIASIFMISASDFAYNVHAKLGIWSGSKQDHTQYVYSLLGNYKMLVIIFNVVPYIVLYYCI